MREVLAYDPDTGGLVWLVDKSWQIRKGYPAGWVSTSGYTKFTFDRVEYYAHRVAWALHNREWPAHQIDHINGDRSDNRILNLREATHAQNGRNLGKSRRNTTGVKGISYDPSKEKFRVRIMAGRQSYHVGYFARFEDAVNARSKASDLYHGEFGRFA